MTVIGGPVRRAGRIGSHEDLYRLELLGGICASDRSITVT